MNDLDWIRVKLETINKQESDKHLTTKQFIDKRAFRENMIVGTETVDSEGVMFNEWEGTFIALTGRKPTEEEFMDYSDWLDSYRKEVSLSIYDNLKVWFDKRRIVMLPKTKEFKSITNEDVDKRIHEVLEKIERIRKEKIHETQNH